MKENLLESIQEQVNAELYSAYLYLSMSSWADREGIKGFANWFRVQAQEELFHATFMHDYLLRRGEPSVMKTVMEPPSGWNSVQAAFEQVCAHERYVTERINNIASIAMENKDHATYQFFMQYVDEQVEEEETANDILQKIRFSQNKPEYIYALDTELAARVYTQPFGTA